MRGRWKLVWQTVVALLAGFYIQRHFGINAVNVPLLAEPIVIGAVPFILFVAFVIVGTSNAVNLTDGLDGLAGGVLIFSFVAYLLIALVALPNTEPGDLLRARHRRARGLPVVQRPPGPDHHGRLGRVRPGCHARGGRHRHRQLVLLAIIGIVFVAEIMSVVIQVSATALRGAASSA
jgi:phospho-N-acetylmuramoyl-pentapeptide-transferase